MVEEEEGEAEVEAEEEVEKVEELEESEDDDDTPLPPRLEPPLIMAEVRHQYASGREYVVFFFSFLYSSHVATCL